MTPERLAEIRQTWKKEPLIAWARGYGDELFDEIESQAARIAELEGDREALRRALLRHSGAGDIEPDDADPLSQRMIGRLTAAADRKNRLLKRLEEQRDEQRARADELEAKLAAATRAVVTAAGIARDVRDYRTERCDSCNCCTVAQCHGDGCPENSIGESTCPCTCY